MRTCIIRKFGLGLSLFIIALLGCCMVTSCGNGNSSSSSSLGSSNDYRELCSQNDFEGAHKVLNSLYKAYIEETDMKVKKTNKQVYRDALDYIFNKEALYLFSLEDETANKRITYLLTEIPVEGIHPSDGSQYMDDHADEFRSYGTTQEKDWGKYYKFVSDYNSKCDQLLDLAIANDNKEVAKKLVAMFKDDIEIVTIPERNRTDYYSSSKSKTAAKAKFKEAFGQ